MPLTILLDMDDTLLSNSMEVFIPAYIKSLASSVGVVDTENFIKVLRVATVAMVRKSTPQKTLEGTFDTHFYDGIGHSKDNLSPLIDLFYREKYPLLKELTQPRPEAQSIVGELLKNKHQVVIATNPLFPATAIHQRLDWAGLAAYKQQFIDITSYENYHYSKPHPEYYAEILAQSGWPEFPAVMIGNSFKDDIVPSESIGLPAFYLTNGSSTEEFSLTNPLSSSGTLSAILPWIKSIQQNPPAPLALSQNGLVTALSVTPVAAETLIRYISPDKYNKISRLLNEAIRTTMHFSHKQYSDNLSDISECLTLFIDERSALIDNLKVNITDELIKQLASLFEADKQFLRALKFL